MFVIKFPAPGVMEVTPLDLSGMFQLKEKQAEETSEQNEEKGEKDDADFLRKS